MKLRKHMIGVCLTGAMVLAGAASMQAFAAETEAVTEAVGGDITVELPTKENGVVSAETWKEQFPEIYESWKANEENSEVIDHVEEYPQIATLYEGMGFAHSYNSARGHSYTLEDVAATGRPHPLANCLTCKTPDYTALVNELGDEAYAMDFEEVYAQMDETVSCYNCHANNAGNGGELVVTHSYLDNAMGADKEKVDPATLSCGQCHNEYYFNPETKATTLPYTSLDTMNPDDILAFYNETGFTDYTNPQTGTQQIKVQHPEFETFMGAGSQHAGTFSCADCHMGKATSAEGVEYVNHKWTSPLNNEELIASTCSACHDDLKSQVAAIQEEEETRVNAIADQLVELTTKLAEAVASGEYTEDELNAIRSKNRDAQFYWDFVFVENSEGAHNSKLTKECLDKAESICAEAMALFK